MKATQSLSPLEDRLSRILDKRRLHSKLRILKSSPPGSVDFSSNDFLSLSTLNGFRRDYLTELARITLPVGSTGSRLLDGNSTYAESLERAIASFHGAESGLLTNSGFDANVSIFTCLPQPGDIVVYDELIHASVYDGMRQSRAAKLISFRHNCVDDLVRVLHECKTERPGANVFIAVESVYSMEGDVAPLAEMVEVIRQLFPKNNGHLIVDEAHATGVYGPQGRGRVSELGLEQQVFVRLHTFGKALACNGAIILCSPIVRSYLVNYARPLIYTTFMSYPSLAAIKTAYDWLETGKTEQLASNLSDLITHFYDRMQSLLPAIANCPALTLSLPPSCPASPILALLTSQPRSLAAHCQAAGFIVRAVVPPTVPDGTERVRVCLHAGNTTQQIDRFVECVGQWVAEQDRKAERDPARGETGSVVVDRFMSPMGKSTTQAITTQLSDIADGSYSAVLRAKL